MDKSEQYVEMCNEAKEIQDKWTPRHGDHLANYESEWLDVDDNTRIRSTNLKDCVMLGVDNISITNRKLCAWLPKQDQLQEMVVENYDQHRELFIVFSKFVRGRIAKEVEIDIFWSGEQCWLNFVMWDRYEKRWNDAKKDWVKL